MSTDHITLRGIRQHNLKGINVDIPKGKLTVITGPSGCGKSSLAFHTLYAEGQRRYLESLGTSAQKTLKGLDKPDYDFIDGLSPTIALRQAENQVPRGTTVGGMTEVHDYLRLLYSTIGVPHDPQSGEKLEKLTSAEIVSRLCEYTERTKVILLAPLKATLLDDVEALKEDLRRQGFVRVAVKETLYELDDDWEVGEGLSVVIDRLMVKEGAESRIADSLEVALQISPAGARCLVQEPNDEGWNVVSFTTGFHNPKTGFLLSRLEASCFSYAAKNSQCQSCKGMGRVDGKKCKSCRGGRLLKDFLSVKLPLNTSEEDFNIAELTEHSVAQMRLLMKEVISTESLSSVVTELIDQIMKRLTFLAEVGLDYLKLSQWGAELSMGEYQRLRLASQLGSGLSGVLYVLDEPSRGLHSSDIGRLIKALHQLRDGGNTVVIVEHDPTLMLAADWMVDLGPGAGELGGEVLAVGSPADLQKSAQSPTGKWLSGGGSVPVERPPHQVESVLRIQNATLNNLKKISVDFPIGGLTVVDGPSGSGKSSLITKTLAPYAHYKLNKGVEFSPAAEITGIEHFQRVVVVDQSPIGRSPRSSPATYTGLFDQVRALYTTLPLAKQRGYQASRFSFNVKGGRCEKCLGSGNIHVALDFLNDSYVTCDACEGRRYNRETLEVRYKGRSVSEVLSASISDNLQHFQHNQKIAPTLQCLVSVGLGYLRLGQGANTLSGGEAQRVKIAAELLKGVSREVRTGRKETTLYLLDEPTRGLHFMDVEVLGAALRSLLVGDNTMIVIEHNAQFLNYADHRVTLGNGGGEAGGRLV